MIVVLLYNRILINETIKTINRTHSSALYFGLQKKDPTSGLVAKFLVDMRATFEALFKKFRATLKKAFVKFLKAKRETLKKEVKVETEPVVPEVCKRPAEDLENVETEINIGIKRYKADDDVVFISEISQEEQIASSVLSDYYSLSEFEKDSCPLNWWKETLKQHPQLLTLSDMSRMYLAIQPTSVE
eukprot:Awhi_evm1s14178